MDIPIIVIVSVLVLLIGNFMFNFFLKKEIKKLKIKARNLSISVQSPEPKVIPPFPVRFESLFVLQEEDSEHEIDSVVVISSIASVGRLHENDAKKIQFKVTLLNSFVFISEWSSFKLADNERKRLLSAIQKYYNYIYKQEK